GSDGTGAFSMWSRGRSAMGLSPLVRAIVDGLASRQLRPECFLVALEMTPDEDGLVLGHRRQLHPRQLGPAAGDAEQALPVTAREPHDPLRPPDVAGQPPAQTLEAPLVEEARRAVDEAAEAVGVQVVVRRVGALG